MRACLPRNRLGVPPTPIADVATSVDSSIGIQEFFVPTFPRCSYSVIVSGNRCGIHREEQSGTRLRLTQEREDALVRVGKIYPFKSSITIIALRKGRVALVKEIEMLDQPSKAVMQGGLEQVPIDALVVIPFLPLANFASHEQQFLAGVRVHPGVKHAEISKFLPWITRHFIQ